MDDGAPIDAGPPSKPEPNPIDLEAARILFERQKFLLEDQIHLAETNRNARRTSSTLLVILVGLGVFKIEQFGSLADQNTIRWLLTAAVGCFLLGAWFLFTERSPWWSAWRGLCRLRMKKTPIQSGLALNALNMTIDEIDAQASLLPANLLVLQAKEFSDTYERLKGANYRVRGRLTKGIILLLAGITLAFGAFLVYIWSDPDDRDPSSTRPHAVAADCQGKGSGDDAQALPPSRSNRDSGSSNPQSTGTDNRAPGSGAQEQGERREEAHQASHPDAP